MSALARNPFEAAARAAKLAKLLDAVDADSSEGGLHPRLDAALVLEGWRNATGLRFAELVERAGIKTPSSITIREFFEALAHRAEMASAS